MYSNIMSLVVLTLIWGLPLFLLAFFGFKIDLWDTEAFKVKYGTFLEGTDHNVNKKYQWSRLAIRMAHFLRRVIFTSSLLFLEEYFFLQILI